MGEHKPRIVQIRRGTTEQHENFKGKIGEVTMDTDAKTLRIHDGQTPGGITLARRDEIPESVSLPDDMDYVTEYSAPGANPWYRKYKSGWVEQGGFVDRQTTSVVTVNFPVEMLNCDYTAMISSYMNSTSPVIIYFRGEPTKTGIGLKAAAGEITRAYWLVSGFSAN